MQVTAKTVVRLFFSYFVYLPGREMDEPRIALTHTHSVHISRLLLAYQLLHPPPITAHSHMEGGSLSSYTSLLLDVQPRDKLMTHWDESPELLPPTIITPSAQLQQTGCRPHKHKHTHTIRLLQTSAAKVLSHTWLHVFTQMNPKYKGKNCSMSFGSHQGILKIQKKLEVLLW